MVLRYLRKTVLTCVAGGFIAMNLPAGAKAETLADALVSAYGHSGLLDQNRALLRVADEDVAIATSALKPILQYTVDITRTFGESDNGSFFGVQNLGGTSATAALLAEVLLYDFGGTAYGIEAAKETVLATREQLVAIEQQVLLRAVAAYMGVIEASEFVALRINNQSLLTQELRAARDRFEVGEVTRTDVALAEAQLAQARSGVATARGNLQIAIEEFRNVIGRGPGNLKPPPRIPALGSIPAAKALAVRQHPALLAAQHQVAAADLRIRQADAQMAPTITLEGRLSVTETRNSDNYNHSGSVGLNLRAPIYQGGALSAQVRRAQANRDAQRGNLHVVRHDVQQNVGDAYARLSSAQASLQASDGQIRAARIAFRGVREEATLGARTTLDVLDAEQALLDAEAARISAQAQVYVAAYSVLSATGQLTAKALGLPVQLYDPSEYYNLVKGSPTRSSKQGQKLDRVLRALQKD